MNPKHRFITDVASRRLTRKFAGALVSSDFATVLTARDILECEAQYMAGTEDVTALVVPVGMVLTFGLRATPASPTLLAQSEPHTLVDGIPSMLFSLNTAEVVAHIAAWPDAANSGKVYFEEEISRPDGSFRYTIAQTQFTLMRELNRDGDEPPAAAAESGALATAKAAEAGTYAALAAAASAFVALTTYAQLRTIVTAGAALPANALRYVVRNGALETWHLRAGTEADDDANFIHPADYTTLVWARVA